MSAASTIGTARASRPFTVAIVGAGPVGSLLFGNLARRGHNVHLFEKRADPRQLGPSEHRSINLAVSPRAYHALDQLGIRSEVLGDSPVMRGRVLHPMPWSIFMPRGYQPFSAPPEHLTRSVSRHGFTCSLLTACERFLPGHFHFHHEATAVDFAANRLRFYDHLHREPRTFQADYIFGADGAGSFVRHALEQSAPDRYHFETVESGIGYKELSIPAVDGHPSLRPEAIHIWLRGPMMMMALPNSDLSFTASILLPLEGPDSFSCIQSERAALQLLRRAYPDVLPSIPNAAGELVSRRIGHLATTRGFPWVSPNGRVALLGDAAHSMLNLYAQGMNCGLEDVSVLVDCLDRQSSGEASDWPAALAEFQALRKPQADAITALSISNYCRARSTQERRRSILMRILDDLFARSIPELYIPRTSIVMFSRTPYVTAKRFIDLQDQILGDFADYIGSPWKLLWRRTSILELARRRMREQLAPHLPHLAPELIGLQDPHRH